MLEHVRQMIQKYQLITPGQTLVVGVSGGTDSLVLLHIFKQLASHFEISLHAATLDHELRGAESAGDVQFVEQICREWVIPVTTGRIDVSTLAQQQQLGIEAAARLARYDFLARVAHELGASTIAVAHHEDDQAETVLMHLLRGTGTHGLAGMALRSAVPGHQDLVLVRPLLGLSRAEIEHYCREHDFAPRYDSTNADTTLLRNAIRLDVLPFLQRYVPRVKPALARLAEIAAAEDDYLQQHVDLFLKSAAVTFSNQHIRIDREAFRGLHAALQRRLLLWAVGELGSLEYTGANLILEAVEIAKHGRHGAVALLGGGFEMRVEYNLLIFEPMDTIAIVEQMPLLPQDFRHTIDVPSSTKLNGWVLVATSTQPIEDIRFCRLAIPNGSMVVLRTRLVGDIFSPLGMSGHHQKLSRWMVNRKIAQRLRDQIPLLIVNNEVAAIHVNDQWFISETFAIRNTSERIIYFQFLENS